MCHPPTSEKLARAVRPLWASVGQKIHCGPNPQWRFCGGSAKVRMRRLRRGCRDWHVWARRRRPPAAGRRCGPGRQPQLLSSLAGTLASYVPQRPILPCCVPQRRAGSVRNRKPQVWTSDVWIVASGLAVCKLQTSPASAFLLLQLCSTKWMARISSLSPQARVHRLRRSRVRARRGVRTTTTAQKVSDLLAFQPLRAVRARPSRWQRPRASAKTASWPLCRPLASCVRSVSGDARAALGRPAEAAQERRC